MNLKSHPNVVRRAQAILARVRSPAPTGAEVGVRIGVLSAELLARCHALFLHMVDSWAPSESQPAHYRATRDPNALLTLSRALEHKAKALAATRSMSSRTKVLHMTSAEAAQLFPDESLDFVFIDADHSYEGCSKDIELWAPKVLPDGVLCGHDYNHVRAEFRGVTRAVDEAFAAHGWKLELGEDYTWFRA
jgi:hypothetical protein